MTKENISATVDPEVSTYCEREDVNTSGLINGLLKQHMHGGSGEKQMLKLRLDQVESRIDGLEGQIEAKREERDKILEALNDLESEKDEILARARENLTEEDLERKNMKVKHWAGEADMSIEELVEELEGTLQ